MVTITAKTQGKDFNYFKKVDVASSSFQDNPEIVINIRGISSFSLVNEGDAVVEYSFNGETVHGDLTPDTPTEAIFFDNRPVSYIWFRTATPGQTVRVEAWVGK